MIKKIQTILEKIKTARPLILNHTNNVTAEFIANGLLSVGASPIMSQAEEEFEDLLKISKAVVLNMGTLDKNFMNLSKTLCTLANKLNIPVIFDPVGSGASKYRTEKAKEILENFSVDILRGNASEIISLTQEKISAKGVDSVAESHQAIESAKRLSFRYNTTVFISGKIDILIFKNQEATFERGSAMMPLITGTGCLLSAVVAAFHAVHENHFEAACCASLFYSVCGEIAATQSKGPGTFKTHFLDALNSPLVQSDYKIN